MARSKNSWYWQLAAQTLTMPTAGKTFYVSAAVGTGNNAQYLQDVMTPDNDGVSRVYSSITLALAACVANRGDVIVIMGDYTTAPTDTELDSAGTKWVGICFANQWWTDEQIAITANKALPASTTADIFKVVGLVEVTSIIGIVTTVIQAQANATKISTVSNGATTDICATLDINGLLAQSRMSITGTFANAMINTLKGVPVARQATPVVCQEWSIAVTTAATNTGNIRRAIKYKALTPWARVYLA